MLCLNNTDTLEGGASVDAKVDYTVHGLVSGVFTKIASGQLSSTNPSIIYTAATAVAIVGITLVNTHTSAVTVDLYIDHTNVGTPRRIIPKALSIQAGYQLVYDGQRMMMIDTAGGIVSGANVSDEVYGASWDAVTSVAPSKNAVYDQMQLQMLKTGSNLAIGSDADGDMYYRAASVLARLAKGSADLKMFMNAGATAPEWANGMKVVGIAFNLTTATGTFDVTGFGFKPSALVCLSAVDGSTSWSAAVNGGGVSKCMYFLSTINVATNIAFYNSGAGTQVFTVSASIADGVTIANTKTASPTGTFTMLFLGIR